MIRLIEALNFRCLRYVRQELGPFHVLVGPNASGKTTFLDVIAFLGRVVSDGPEAAIAERTRDFRDMVFAQSGDVFELAIEAVIPEERKVKLKRNFDTIRYELRIGLDAEKNEIGVQTEKPWLKQWNAVPPSQRELFPLEPSPPNSIITGKTRTGWQPVLTKAFLGNDNFYVEVRESRGGKGWFPSIRLGPRKSALLNTGT
ncbi:MAG: AAA family ATPase [bacterium]